MGTMLLAIATLGAGVSAEQSNERLSGLEDLGILELSMDDGVVEAMVTTDAFLSFIGWIRIKDQQETRVFKTQVFAS